MTLAKLLIVASTVATPVAAAPRIVPMQDVTVNYTLHPRDHAPLDLHVNIEAGGARLRVTAQELPTALLIDRRAHVATILLPVLKLFATVDIGRYDVEQTVLRNARFERRGRSVVAGRGCTEWLAVSSQGRASACITEDGVILRGRAADAHGELGDIVAGRVEYGRIPLDFFELPPGYSNAGTLPIEGFSGAAP